jgi:hypothetical protein
MYCHDPIYECMGYALPRDVLAFLEGRLAPGQTIRELCPKESCNEKWKQELENEVSYVDF